MEGEPRFAHDLLEGRLALRDRGHPVLQMTGHLRTREVRAVDREGVDEGPSCGRRPHRSAAHELSTEQEVEDLMAGGLRAEFEPLHREQEEPCEWRGGGLVRSSTMRSSWIGTTSPSERGGRAFRGSCSGRISLHPGSIWARPVAANAESPTTSRTSVTAVTLGGEKVARNRRAIRSYIRERTLSRRFAGAAVG